MVRTASPAEPHASASTGGPARQDPLTSAEIDEQIRQLFQADRP
jgi:hypothetical protein